MKQFYFCCLIFLTFSANAQLVYLGDDVYSNSNKTDGYFLNKKIQGLVALNNNYFFITPNGNFYQTDGTKEKTEIKYQFAPQEVGYLKATKKYIYFTEGSINDIKDLIRYSPATGFNKVKLGGLTGNNHILRLNQSIVPGSNSSVDEMFVSYDKDEILIRKFDKDFFQIFIIKDDNNNSTANLVCGEYLNMNNITTPISTNTEVEIYKGDIFFNGKENPTGIYETTISVFKPSLAIADKYEFKSKFALLKNGKLPYDRMLRTKNNMYALVKTEDKDKKQKKFQLFQYSDSKLTSAGMAIEHSTDDAAAQVIEDEIYISFKGHLVKYIEETKNYNIIMEGDINTGWEDIKRNTRFLKMSNYYMYRSNGALFVYNYLNNTSKEVSKSLSNGGYNYVLDIRMANKIHAYAGSRNFYFPQVINDKEVFTKYNPITDIYSTIDFPAFNNHSFKEIKAVMHYANKFVFLTEYRAKKNIPVYKMFMYTEE